MVWRLNPDRRDRLVDSIRRHAATPEGRCRLQAKREEAKAYRKHPEWMWRALVLSFSTVQTKGDRVWKNVETKLPLVEFSDVVAQPGEDARKQFLSNRLDKVGYRFPNRFCGFLANAVHRFEELGGPTLAAATLTNASDAEKVAFFVQFKGISHKYARNMWMDVDPGALISTSP